MKMGPDEIKAMLAGGGSIIPSSFPGDPVDPGMRNMLMAMMGSGRLKPMEPAPTNIASMVMQQRPAGMGQSMTYELAQLNDGGLVLMSNQDLPDELRRVEYFMGQKLFNLVFNGGGEEMVPYETSDLADQIIRGANGLILVISAKNADHLYGYSVPLVQVGV